MEMHFKIYQSPYEGETHFYCEAVGRPHPQAYWGETPWEALTKAMGQHHWMLGEYQIACEPIDDSYYQHPREVWDAKKCAKMAKKRYFTLGHYAHGTRVRYNGGTVVPWNGPEEEQKWYPGEQWPLPEVAEGYVLVRVPTWGYKLIRIEEALKEVA